MLLWIKVGVLKFRNFVSNDNHFLSNGPFNFNLNEHIKLFTNFFIAEFTVVQIGFHIFSNTIG